MRKKRPFHKEDNHFYFPEQMSNGEKKWDWVTQYTHEIYEQRKKSYKGWVFIFLNIESL